MQYVRVESYSEERPLEIDTVSSKTAVYIRKDIEEVPNEEGTGTHWSMLEAKLTPEEFKWYREQMESPSFDILSQRLNDLEANQELADITSEENQEAVMQLLNDIQADILDSLELEV